MLSQAERTDVSGLPISSIRNDIGVVLEPNDAQQSVMVGWLFAGRNAQPFMVAVEPVSIP